MRAVLLAIATATTFAGLRASSCVTQGYFSGWARACLKTASAPTIRMRRKYWSPCFEIGPSRCLPPVESSRGTMPIQAAKSRPLLKIEASGTRGDNGARADDTDTGNGLEPLAVRILAMLREKALLDRPDFGLARGNLRNECR